MPALTVPTIFTAVDKLSSIISKMQGNVGKFASESQKKYAAMSRSAQAWSTNSRQIAMSSGIMGAALIAPLVLATNAAADFEDQMANVGTIVGEKNLPFLSEGTLAVLRKTPVPLHDLTEALYKITSAGVPASQALDVLTKSAQLGVAGRGTAIQGADALTSAMNVFKDEGLSTNKMMSMLFQTVKLGKTTIEGLSESFGSTANIVHSGGVSMKDFLSATAAMTVMGEPATQAMNQIRASVFGLEKPTQRMKFIFKELGVKNIHELIGKFGNLGNSMSAIEEKGKKLGVNMGQAWGKVGSYAAVIALTGARGKGAYNTNLAGMGSSEEDFAVAYALKLKTMNAQLQLVKNNMLDFSIVLGTQLIPVLTKILPKISAFINSIADWIGKHKELTGTILKVVGGLGLFLLAVAPLALIISGVADAMKVYAGIQLFFAERAALATAAIEAQAVAYAGNAEAAYEAAYAGQVVSKVGFVGMLGQLSAIAALAWTIDKYWKSWGDSITALLGPFGELFNMMEQIKGGSNKALAADDKQGGFAGYAKGYGDILAGYAGSISQFFSAPAKGIASAFGGNLKAFGDTKAVLPNIANPATSSNNNSTTQNNLSIDFNDPFGMVKSTKQSGPLMIPIKTTSTTGNK